MSELTKDNKIVMYFHCGTCLLKKPGNVSPREWARLSVGWTELGFQVWCVRCEKNVITMDFQGQQHPAI